MAGKNGNKFIRQFKNSQIAENTAQNKKMVLSNSWAQARKFLINEKLDKPPKNLSEIVAGYHSLNIFTTNEFYEEYRSTFKSQFLSMLFCVVNISIVSTLLVLHLLNCTQRQHDNKFYNVSSSEICLLQPEKIPYNLQRERGQFETWNLGMLFVFSTLKITVFVFS